MYRVYIRQHFFVTLQHLQPWVFHHPATNAPRNAHRLKPMAVHDSEKVVEWSDSPKDWFCQNVFRDKFGSWGIPPIQQIFWQSMVFVFFLRCFFC